MEIKKEQVDWVRVNLFNLLQSPRITDICPELSEEAFKELQKLNLKSRELERKENGEVFVRNGGSVLQGDIRPAA